MPRFPHFFCYISRFDFQELGGGGRGAGGFLPLAAAIPVCIIAGRVASVQELFSFVLPPLNVYGLGGWVGGVESMSAALSLRGGAFGMHVNGSEERCAEIFSLSRFRRSILTDWVGWRLRGR